MRAVIERIVTPLGRRIDESSPLVDARLKDGSRVNAVIRPIALRGSCITIRKFSRTPLTLEKLVGFGAITERMARFLVRSVHREAKHRHLRRHRLRQDDAPQLPLGRHPRATSAS